MELIALKSLSWGKYLLLLVEAYSTDLVNTFRGAATRFRTLECYLADVPGEHFLGAGVSED